MADLLATHGKDFSMGALVLAARWIAENRLGNAPLSAAKTN